MATSSGGGDYYAEWPDPWKPKALPESLNIDGKHVWEPPILAYNHLIGEEYEKKREAVLKYTKDDRARTTEILDIDVEFNLLSTYWNWAEDNMHDARDSGDSERASFFVALWSEVYIDWDDAKFEYYKFGVRQKRLDDGTWKIMSWKEYYKRGMRWRDEESLGSDHISSGSSEASARRSGESGEKDENGTERLPNNQRISTAATDAEELSWLSSIDPEAYPPMPCGDEGDADNDASPASSDSDVYADARSTLSEHDSDQDNENGREVKRRRIDFWNVIGVSKH